MATLFLLAACFVLVMILDVIVKSVGSLFSDNDKTDKY